MVAGKGASHLHAGERPPGPRELVSCEAVRGREERMNLMDVKQLTAKVTDTQVCFTLPPKGEFLVAVIYLRNQ